MLKGTQEVSKKLIKNFWFLMNLLDFAQNLRKSEKFL